MMSKMDSNILSKTSFLFESNDKLNDGPMFTPTRVSKKILSRIVTSEKQVNRIAFKAKLDYYRKWQLIIEPVVDGNRILIEEYLREIKLKASKRCMNEVEFPIMHHQKRFLTSPDIPASKIMKKDCKYTIIAANRKRRMSTFKPLQLANIPRCPEKQAWTCVQQNFRVEDEPVLRFIPYFGDEDHEDVVSQVYHKQGQYLAEDEREDEMCDYVFNKLKSTLGIGADQIDIKTLSATLEVPEYVCSERVSIGSPPTANKKDPIFKVMSSAPPSFFNENYLEYMYIKAMDSFRRNWLTPVYEAALFCRRCYVYDCRNHGLQPVPNLCLQTRNAVHKRNKLLLSQNRSSKEHSSYCCDRCCISEDITADKHILGDLSNALLVIIYRAAFVTGANFCTISVIIGKNFSCKDIAQYCTHYGLTFDNIRDSIIPISKSKKRSRKSTSNKYIRRSEDPNTIHTAFVPCCHEGPCTAENGCECFLRGQFCTKHCYCLHVECKNQFKGCRCVKGRCRTKACPCFAASRECDPDICHLCTGKDLDQLFSCQNRNISTRNHKHLMLASSEVENAGWGAFVQENVQKDEFVEEYSGEIVSQDEAERRGLIYDKVNRSYLFNLDTDNVVDATRKGNKSKFANHSQDPNCYTRIMNCNGENRIGLYARYDIPAQSEIFFDYRYEKEIVHEVLHKSSTIVDWMEDSKMAGKVSKKDCSPRVLKMASL